MVGVPNITVQGEKGSQIKLRFTEMLNDDSEGADGLKDRFIQQACVLQK
ncbi:family 78 glycoside hydrolase catalytic domain [Gracilibacillus boraciitolerans]|nr:family 78 glycoside hydrolase catalytic domain [Gracilibacillus boraciitolerans]